MDIQKLQRAVVDALEDVKAQDIKVFNTEHLTSMFDRVVIASATSNRQTRALANSVADKSRSIGNPVIATEGEETGEWTSRYWRHCDSHHATCHSHVLQSRRSMGWQTRALKAVTRVDPPRRGVK